MKESLSEFADVILGQIEDRLITRKSILLPFQKFANHVLVGK